MLNFRDYLRANGHKVDRIMIRPSGALTAIFTDLFDATLRLLVEAKAHPSRASVRMAIGQLADYGRFIFDCQRAILLPSRPGSELVALAGSQSIEMIWPAPDAYETTNRDLTLALRSRM